MRNQLIRIGAPLVLFIALLSCSSEGTKDKQFCECIESTEKLEKFSSELFKRTPTQEDAKKMKKLRSEKERLCDKYYMMSGEEMLKRKKACEQ